MDNFVGLIVFTKTTGFASNTISSIAGYIVWYAGDKEKIKYRQLFKKKVAGDEGASKYKSLSAYKAVTETVKNKYGVEILASLDQITSQGSTGSSSSREIFEMNGVSFTPLVGTYWKTSVSGLERLAKVICRVLFVCLMIFLFSLLQISGQT